MIFICKVESSRSPCNISSTHTCFRILCEWLLLWGHGVCLDCSCASCQNSHANHQHFRRQAHQQRLGSLHCFTCRHSALLQIRRCRGWAEKFVRYRLIHSHAIMLLWLCCSRGALFLYRACHSCLILRYHGYSVQIAVESFGRGAYFCAYELCKQHFSKENGESLLPLHYRVASGACAGLVGW